MALPRMATRLSVWPILFLCLALTGCASTQIVDIFKQPIRIGVVSNNYLDVSIRYRPLCDALNRKLKQPVVPLADLSSQSIAVHLKSNPKFYQLLYLDPVSYFEVSNQHRIFPLAMKVNMLGKTEVQGLIVTSAKSKIKILSELSGKRFAFGPYGSTHMFYNALQTLQAAGISADNLGDLSYAPDSNTVANRLILGWSDVGVVTDVWWHTTAAKALDGKLLKDHLRIIARTELLPEAIWASTESLDQAKRGKIQVFLLEQLQGQGSILQPLSAEKFIVPDKSTLQRMGRFVRQIKKLPPRPLLQL